MRQNVYSSAVCTGSQPLCTQILPGQGRPSSTILGTRILETLGYPMVETSPSVFPRFDTYLRVTDGLTNGQTDGYAVTLYSACKASLAARRKH